MPPFVDSYYFETLLWLCASALLLRWGFLGYETLQLQRKSQRALVDRINAQLPQTQCGQCGHAGCMPYARAISAGEAINKCPPGGPVTIRRLARVLNQPLEQVDPAHGRVKTREVAVIREAECIGCTKCIVACPVDAILGAAKLMHTVISSECTGCDLCVAPCPVDCIDMIALSPPTKQWLAPGLSTDAASTSQQESAPC